MTRRLNNERHLFIYFAILDAINWQGRNVVREVKVSVISPCYNEVDSIGRLINSILAQTHKSIELIIVDGGSSDGTLEVAQRYTREYPNLVSLYMEEGEERSPANAKNIGIDYADGELVYFKDADCALVDKRCLEKIVKSYLLQSNPDVISIDVKYVTDPKSLVQRAIHVLRYLPNKDTVYSRKSIGTERFDTTLGTGEDLDFHIRVSKLARKTSESGERTTIWYAPVSLGKWIRRHKWYGRTCNAFRRKYPAKFSPYPSLKAMTYLGSLSIIPVMLYYMPWLWVVVPVWFLPLAKQLIGSFRVANVKKYFVVDTFLTYVAAISFSVGYLSSLFSKRPAGRD